ncbi:unnamed protein product, partial [Rotaria sp. Silwood2]
LFLGYGNGIFEEPTMYSTGSYSSISVAIGDLNKDHRLDIVVIDDDTGSIDILLGQYEGILNQTELSTGSSSPIDIIAVDLNNDSLLDIVTANYRAHSISIFYGSGHGNFSPPIMYSTGYDSLPSSLTAGDFNNDSYLDLAIANYGTHNIAILFRTTNGTYEKQVTFSTGFGSHPYSIAVGHFNTDKLTDIAIANSGTLDISVLINNGNRTFANQITYSVGSASPNTIVIGDFNQDNRFDIVTINNGVDNIALFLGYGNGIFEEPTMYSTGSYSSISVAIG